MGIFDNIQDVAGGFGGNQQQAGIARALFDMVRGSQGGLSGMLQQFAGAGLQSKVYSWVGTGQNEPISSDEVERGLGQDNVRQIANKAGVTPDEAKSSLASMLPSMVDRLTPDGKVPDQNALGGMIGKLFGKVA